MGSRAMEYNRINIILNTFLAQLSLDWLFVSLCLMRCEKSNKQIFMILTIRLSDRTSYMIAFGEMFVFTLLLLSSCCESRTKKRKLLKMTLNISSNLFLLFSRTKLKISCYYVWYNILFVLLLLLIAHL